MPSPFVNSPESLGRPSPVVKDRLTVVETVYHQSMAGGPPFVSLSQFHRDLDTYEQVYERRHLKVGEDWQRVDLGWIESCGMLVVQNEEGMHCQVNPTEEETKRRKSKVLEVSLCDNPCDSSPLLPTSAASWLVPPGETMRAVPSDPKSLFIRCRSGEAYYTIRAFPA